MSERRVCACRGVIETEPDERSVVEAVREHYAQPEHQEFVAAVELFEESLPAIDVRIRSTWIGVTAGLRRVS